MKITKEQLCKALSEHDGEEITNLAQVTLTSFSGEELLEFINSIEVEQPTDDEIHEAANEYEDRIGEGVSSVYFGFRGGVNWILDKILTQ